MYLFNGSDYGDFKVLRHTYFVTSEINCQPRKTASKGDEAAKFLIPKALIEIVWL
jgi:hypothetical protein